MSTDAGHGQLRRLLGLRWRMLREPKQRRRVAIAFALLPLFIVAAVIVGQLAPDESGSTSPCWPRPPSRFFALAVISPASSAGGSELFPTDQLVAYPVRDRTVFGSTLLLAPANLAWITTFLLLIGVTSYVSALGPLVVFSLLTAVVFAAAATLTGQAIAWWLEGVRQRREGRWALRVVGGVLVLVGVTLQLTHHLTSLLDRAADPWVAISAVKGSQGLWWPLGDRFSSAWSRPACWPSTWARAAAAGPRARSATAASSPSRGRFADGRPPARTCWR